MDGQAVSGLGDFAIVALFGGLWGLSEIVSRYRDAPAAAVRSLPSVLYIVINAAVSFASLFLTRVFGFSFGTTWAAGDAKLRAIQVLASGFAAMAVLRTSVFTVRVANHDVGIGPSAAVQAFLRAADAAVDRQRSVQRESSVSLLGNVPFDAAFVALPLHCLALMQNLPDEDQKRLAGELERIKKVKANDALRCKLLGLALLNVVGEEVLGAAVKSLKEQLKIEAAK